MRFTRKVVADEDGDGLAQPGEILTYTITVSSSGDCGASILITDTLPPELTYVDGSLDFDFPGIGFVAMVTNHVHTGHTDGYLSPPSDGSLPVGAAATIMLAARVGAPVPTGDDMSNLIELRAPFSAYVIPPAMIPLQSAHKVLLALVLRSSPTLQE